MLVSKDNSLSIRKQCDLLDINRSTVYYNPKGESEENLRIMQIMDKQILEEPTAGVLTMQSMLEEQGIEASYERISRLMRLADIRPIYPRRHLTKWKNYEYVHPYLLKDLKIERSNQVWEIDITYVPMRKGFMYLTAVIDVYSRYIVGWGLSNSLDAESSLQALKQAITMYGNPEIINSDRGS